MFNSDYYIAVDRNGDFRIFYDIPIMCKIDIMETGPDYEDPHGRIYKLQVPSGKTFNDWAIHDLNGINKWDLGKKIKSSCIPNFLLDMTHNDKPYKISE